MNDKVIAVSFNGNPNPQGTLHELASRGDIRGFIITCRLDDGTHESVRCGMDSMGDHSLAVAVQQESLNNRIKTARESQ
jgi:hypothetical protein